MRWFLTHQGLLQDTRPRIKPLPEYDLLDQILYHYIEQDWSISDIVAAGFDESVVRRVAAMVIRNEYKRRQGAPGVRITSRAFSRDRRYPITSGWHEENTGKPDQFR